MEHDASRLDQIQERRDDIRRLFDGLHKLSTGAILVGVIWIVSTTSDNRQQTALLSQRVELLAAQMEKGSSDRYTASDAAKDARYFLQRVDVNERNITEIMRRLETIEKGNKP